MIASLSYAGLFASSFLAATVLPFASEAVLVGVLLAGRHPVACVVVATLGNTLGGITSYGLGYLGDMAWIERYLRVEAAQAQRWRRQIERYGSLLAFFAWLPVVGDGIAVALGFFKVRPLGVAVYMFAGKACRYTCIAVYTVYAQQAWSGAS